MSGSQRTLVDTTHVDVRTSTRTVVVDVDGFQRHAVGAVDVQLKSRNVFVDNVHTNIGDWQEAPTDGAIYGRRNAKWTEVVDKDGSVHVTGDLNVDGTTNIRGDLVEEGDLHVRGDVHVSGIIHTIDGGTW